MTSPVIGHRQPPLDAETSRVPPDPALPGMATLFHPARIARSLQAASGVEVRNGCITYVRYKPLTSCVAAYRFECDGAAPGAVTCFAKAVTAPDFAIGTAGLGLHRWEPSPPLPPYLVLDTERIILFAFPNDPALDGLRLFADARRLRRAIQGALPDYDPGEWRISDGRLRTTIVRYKPEKRAVLRIDTKAIRHADGSRRPLTVYGRVYGESQSRARYEGMERIAAGAAGRVRVPRVIAHLDDRNTVLLEQLEGEPMDALLDRPDVAAMAGEAGAVLAALHGIAVADLATRDAGTLLGEAGATAESIAAVLPEAGPRARGLVDRLRARWPGAEPARAFVHGDFHPGQLLVHDGGMGVLDFDRSYAGCGAADLGNFHAHLVGLEIERGAATGPLAAEFLEGYARHREPPRADELRRWSALGLLRLAIRPFRTFDPNWPRKVDAMLAAAEALAP